MESPSKESQDDKIDTCDAECNNACEGFAIEAHIQNGQRSDEHDEGQDIGYHDSFPSHPLSDGHFDLSAHFRQRRHLAGERIEGAVDELLLLVGGHAHRLSLTGAAGRGLLDQYTHLIALNGDHGSPMSDDFSHYMHKISRKGSTFFLYTQIFLKEKTKMKSKGLSFFDFEQLRDPEMPKKGRVDEK